MENSPLKSKFEPCQKELVQELLDLGSTGKLRLQLREELGKYGIREFELKPGEDPHAMARQKGFKSLLQTDIQQVALRECRPRGTFCVEVVVRARLFDFNANKYLYDTVFLYSDLPWQLERSPFRWAALPFHAHGLHVSESPACRNIEAYCREDGRKALREELSRAINLSLKWVLHYFGLEFLAAQPNP